jgi:hypothetical protein
MLLAVRLTRLRLGVTEAEARGAGLTDRPTAGHQPTVRARRRLNARGRRHGSRPRRTQRRMRHRRDHLCAGKRRQRRPGDPPRRRPARCSATGTAASNRRRTRRQVEPMRLSHHGVLRNAEPPADLGSRKAFGPQRTEARDRFLGPLHFVGSPTVRPQDTVAGGPAVSTTKTQWATKSCGKLPIRSQGLGVGAKTTTPSAASRAPLSPR